MDILTFVLWIAAGLVVLLAGRRLFWLVAGLVAFLFATSVMGQLLGDSLLALIVGIAAGVVLAYLAIKFVKIVAYIMGGMAGAVALPAILSPLAIGSVYWLIALIGAAIGVALIAFAFDWGLIIVTALAGASAVVSTVDGRVPLGDIITIVAIIALVVVGIGAQRAQLKASETPAS